MTKPKKQTEPASAETTETTAPPSVPNITPGAVSGINHEPLTPSTNEVTESEGITAIDLDGRPLESAGEQSLETSGTDNGTVGEAGEELVDNSTPGAQPF